MLHGSSLVDPYRWLEGDEHGELTPEVSALTDQQNAYTREVLDQLPGRAALEQMPARTDGSPGHFAAGHVRLPLFYSRREGDQPQALTYVRERSQRRGPAAAGSSGDRLSGLTTVA